ncbi:MAG: hypothetical protein Ta2D_08400 [Rickettsiales bacterium]|nr:MAG: hypothetical protein Ta2D_08400 [Rickettsiales bacterium]
MKFRWDEDKNQKLIRERGFSFEDLICDGEFLSERQNTSSNHKDQFEYHNLYNGYIYKIKFLIEKDGTRFLKTAYRDSRLNKKYKKLMEENL